MTMNREDILRELELWPLWQQRPTLAHEKAGAVESISPPAMANPHPASLVTTEPLTAIEPTEPTKHALPGVLAFTAWHCPATRTLFVLAPAQQPEADELLGNMLKAISLSAKQTQTPRVLDELTTDSTQLIVALGETVAQQILRTQDKLENLRGKVHHANTIACIASYAPADLLVNAALKANAWQDLCLVAATLQDLQQ